MERRRRWWSTRNDGGILCGYTTAMFGIRVLLYIVGIALVVWILLRLAKSPGVENKPQKKVGNTVSCSRCGTYVPREEALQNGDRYYCCSKHRDEDN